MYNNHTEPPALSIIRTKWKQYFLHFIDHWRVWISTGPFQLFESTQIFGIKFFITPRKNSWLLLYTVHNAQQPDSKGDSLHRHEERYAPCQKVVRHSTIPIIYTSLFTIEMVAQFI